MSDKILTTVADNVLTITLNRPDQRNAIDFELLDALVATLDEAQHDSEIAVVTLKGEGRSFCAGADIGQMVERTPAEWEAIVDHYLDPVRLIATMEKPVIVRCHGDVVGGGLGLAIAADFRVAAEGSRYCAPFVNLGLAGCDMSCGYFLPRLIGMGRATDMMMTARFVDAAEALEMGLISRIVPEEALNETVASLAQTLAAFPSRGIGFTKGAIRRSVDLDMNAEFDYEIFAQVQCLQSEAHRERVAAFLEQRGQKR